MMKRRILNIFYIFLIATFIFALLAFSSICSENAYTAITLCAKRVIPSLFPFFVISNLIINLGLHKPLSRIFNRLMPTLFSLSSNSATAVVLGLTSGYPLGAATCAELYKSGEISRREAERLLSFCNNSGPGFCLGICGLGIFHSLRIGTLLFLIHTFSALLVGFFLRIVFPISHSHIKTQNKTASTKFPIAFTDAIAHAVSSSLKISAYIIFFTQISALLEKSGIIKNLFCFSPEKASLAEGIVCGILEITSGIYKVSEATPPETAFIIISTLLGFGGFSVHFQALSFVADVKLSAREYFIGKVLHGAFSAILAFVFARSSIFKTISVFSPINANRSTSSVSLLFALIFISILYIFSKKAGKKHRNSVY